MIVFSQGTTKNAQTVGLSVFVEKTKLLLRHVVAGEGGSNGSEAALSH